MTPFLYCRHSTEEVKRLITANDFSLPLEDGSDDTLRMGNGTNGKRERGGRGQSGCEGGYRCLDTRISALHSNSRTLSAFEQST